MPASEQRPMRYQPLQYLFYLRDERLKDRTGIFSQQYTLGWHVENRIGALQERVGTTRYRLCAGIHVLIDPAMTPSYESQRV